MRNKRLFAVALVTVAIISVGGYVILKKPVTEVSAGSIVESSLAESSLAEGSGEDKEDKQNGYPSDASLGTGDGSATGEQTQSEAGEAGGEDARTEPENTESGVQSNAGGANVVVDGDELKDALDASALEQINGTGGSTGSGTQGTGGNTGGGTENTTPPASNPNPAPIPVPGTGGYGQYISDEETNSRGSFYDVDTSGLSTNVEIY